MTRVSVNGIFLNVEVTGDGPIVLLLHGFTRDSRAWEPVLPALDGYRVVRVDLIGHGKSDAPATPRVTPWRTPSKTCWRYYIT